MIVDFGCKFYSIKLKNAIQGVWSPKFAFSDVDLGSFNFGDSQFRRGLILGDPSVKGPIDSLLQETFALEEFFYQSFLLDWSPWNRRYNKYADEDV